MNEENKFVIDEELVQMEAQSCLERDLTSEELADVFEAICEEWIPFIQDRIRHVIDFNEMLERNKGAENEPVHFDAYHRNTNAYQFTFGLAGSFRNEADAREYIHHDFITEFDEWQIFRVDDAGKHEVWSVNVNSAKS